MNSYKFNVKGQERKSLVSAISEITNTPVNYQGAPTFAFTVGEYHIDKEGTVTGEYDFNLFVGLAERGYEPGGEPPLAMSPAGGTLEFTPSLPIGGKS